MVKELVTIEKNPNGGIMHVPSMKGVTIVHIKQNCIDDTGEVTERRATLTIPLECIDELEAGDVLAGNILIRQSTLPLDYSAVEDGLKWLPDGTVARTADGKVIYEYTEYSQEEEDGDELV